MKAYNEIPVEGGFPFFLLNPFFFLFAFTAMLLAWKWAQNSRKWLIITTVIGLGVALSLIFYMAPLIVLTNPVKMPSSEVIRRVNEWKFGNELRLIAEFFGFVFSIVALKTWSVETSIVTKSTSSSVQ
jgi:hypothetical protein